MNVLVLGVEGMLGHVVKLYFEERGYTVKGTSRSSGQDYILDATQNLQDVKTFIEESKAEVVINCIGILNKVAEENKSLAVMINSYLPHYVDELCRNIGVKFVHVSTDCVFDGKSGGYTEDSFRNATDFYGRSKALGEVDNDKSITLRTSIVGPDINQNGVGLFQWFMNQDVEAGGWDKAVWTGVTTIEFAKSMEKAIQNNLSGIRHVVNNDTIDKFSLLNLFKKHFSKKIEVVPKGDHVVDKSLKRTTDFDFGVPSYDQMIKEMADWVTRHESIYSEKQRVTK